LLLELLCRVSRHFVGRPEKGIEDLKLSTKLFSEKAVHVLNTEIPNNQFISLLLPSLGVSCFSGLVCLLVHFIQRFYSNGKALAVR